MGLKNYRLSISMPRVLPGASGPPNEDGIAFYNRLIDCLLAADITPCVSAGKCRCSDANVYSQLNEYPVLLLCFTLASVLRSTENMSTMYEQ